MKSSWEEDGLPDHDRPLAPRGQRALATMADYLRHRKGATPRPDLILCSTATRTRQTLAGLMETGRVWTPPPPVLLERGLYMAQSSQLLDRLGALGRQGDPDAVLLIGHNPGLEDLALSLALGKMPGDAMPEISGEEGSDIAPAPQPPRADNDALTRLADKYPTGAFAWLELDIATWADASPGTASLRAFITPRDLADG